MASMGPVLALVSFVVLLFGVAGIYLFGRTGGLYYRCDRAMGFRVSRVLCCLLCIIAVVSGLCSRFGGWIFGVRVAFVVFYGLRHGVGYFVCPSVLSFAFQVAFHPQTLNLEPIILNPKP